jgi:hypothetical protein
MILFVILTFFMILLIVYLSAIPVDKITTAIRYLYILSVKPSLLGKGSTAQIFLSSSLTIDPNKIHMFAVSPGWL